MNGEQARFEDGSQRDARGVRVRVDGKGDYWADEHRKALGTECLMQDLDWLQGIIVFSKDAEESLFVEYAPDPIHNKGNVIRKFGIVALIDRKKTMYGVNNHSILSRGVYLYLCKTLGSVQPFDLQPRFFYLVGEDYPWIMLELDVHTGKPIGKRIMIESRDHMKILYEDLGLLDTYDKLERWLKEEEDRSMSEEQTSGGDALAW